MRQVVVTGIGAVTPLGLGARPSWKRLLDGECGVASLRERGEGFKKLQCQVAGLVPLSSKNVGGWTASEWLTRDEERRMAQFAQYGIVAAHEALEDSAWRPQNDEGLERTGVCLGSGIGAFDDVYNTSIAFDRGGAKKVSPLFVPRLLINLAAGHVSMKYGFKGPNHAVTTACTTGAHSIGDAARFIAFGDADVMVAGGAESCIHPLAVTGFERSRSLTTSSNHKPEIASRPFSQDRDGFVIGEGAAVLILEELNHALARGATIYAQLASYAATADAHHLTQPPPDGNGAYRSMRRALQSAQISPHEVDYINAHATSTPQGDLAETKAIKKLMLSEHGVQTESDVCVSGTKGATGHLLGASGAIEALFSVLAVKEDIVPPTLNLDRVDKELPSFNYVAHEAQSKKVDVVLSNSFGFGGTNATLCFKKWQ